VLPMFDAGHELPLGRRLIAPASDQDVEDMAVLVDRTPQIMTYAIDGQKHLVEMSCVPWSRAPTPELVGIGLPKLSAPRAHGLVRQHDPTFCRHFFDMAVAEAEAEIQPHAVAEELCGEPMALLRVEDG
jgi:hypothetical protein